MPVESQSCAPVSKITAFPLKFENRQFRSMRLTRKQKKRKGFPMFWKCTGCTFCRDAPRGLRRTAPGEACIAAASCVLQERISRQIQKLVSCRQLQSAPPVHGLSFAAPSSGNKLRCILGQGGLSNGIPQHR
eukprot:1098309-Rhodomonas_salina.2